MKLHLVSTHVPGLDVVLGGGIPTHQTVIVSGAPGSGKTLLCSQIAFEMARRKQPVVIATVTSEPYDKLVGELRAFRFFDGGALGEEVFFVSAYPWLKKGPREARELLLGSLRERKAKMLFVDGLRSVRDLWQDEAKVREFLYELSVGLTAIDCVGLLTAEYDIATLLERPEATTADGIINLSVEHRGSRRYRRLEVVKLRGRPHVMGTHVLHVDHEGLRVVPRLESAMKADLEARPTGRRASFGLPEFDALLHGGLPEQTTTLLAGSTGVGKTLLSLRWAGHAARAGEKAILLTFTEPPQRLLARAAAVGIDVRDVVERGHLRIEYRPPGEDEADEIVDELLEQVREMGATRLVLDGISELEAAIVDPVRVRAFLTAFIIRLRVAGVTSIFVKEVATVTGPELDFSDTPISATAENVLFLRYVEMGGSLHRLVSVLKMRESGYDQSLREYRIDEEGVRVLEPFRSVEGLLTGQARAVGTQFHAPRGE